MVVDGLGGQRDCFCAIYLNFKRINILQCHAVHIHLMCVHLQKTHIKYLHVSTYQLTPSFISISDHHSISPFLVKWSLQKCSENPSEALPLDGDTLGE